MAHQETQGQQESKDQQECEDLTDPMVHPEAEDQREKQEPKEKLENQVPRDVPDQKVTKDKLDAMVWLDLLEKMVLMEISDHQDLQDRLALRDEQETQDQMDLQDPLDHPDLQVTLDRSVMKGQPVKQVIMVSQEMLANPENPGHLDHPVTFLESLHMEYGIVSMKMIKEMVAEGDGTEANAQWTKDHLQKNKNWNK